MSKYASLQIIYCNLNIKGVAHDLFDSISEDIEADVMCCSEPNRKKAKYKNEWMTDKNNDVAQRTREEVNHENGSGNQSARSYSTSSRFACEPLLEPFPQPQVPAHSADLVGCSSSGPLQFRSRNVKR